jgi:signal transduction histidine kinase
LEHAREQAGKNSALAETLAEMTEDVARLEKVAARFQEIGVPVKPIRADVVPLVERAVAYGRRRAPAKARLAIEAKAAGPLVIPHSPVLVEWVVENLVKNAVDATKDLPAGKGRIVVAAREEGRYAVVAVTDNGVGVAPEDAPYIFAPGYTTKDKGWGLGLSLVKRIVEDVHGGRLEVWSEPGAGATFSAYFPRG